MAALAVLALLPVAAVYAIRSRRRREAWEQQGPLFRSPKYGRQQFGPPLEAPFPAIPVSAAGGELHVSIQQLQILDSRRVCRWFGREWRRIGAAGRPRFEIQLGSTIISSGPLPVDAILYTANGLAPLGILPVGASEENGGGVYRLPLQEGQSAELKLFLYQRPGSCKQKLKAVARVPLAHVFAAGADAPTVHLFSRRGTAPLAVQLGLSYVGPAQAAVAAAKAVEYGT